MKYIVRLFGARCSRLEVFFWIYWVFDKVWHQGLLLKLESFGICEKLLNLLENYFSNKFQRVLLNSKESSRLPLKEVPQRFILEPVFNTLLMTCLMSSVSLLNCLPIIHHFLIFFQDLNESARYLNIDLSLISQWVYQWKMLFNSDFKKLSHKVIFPGKKMK